MTLRHRPPGLVGRLLLALAVTLLVSGGVAYFVVPVLMEQRFVSEQAAVHAADARAVARAARRAEGSATLREVSEELEDMASRPGVRQALLVDRRGTIVASGDRAQVGDRDTDAFARQTARGGGRPAELAERHGGELSYVVPVNVDGRRLALQADRDDAELEQGIAELQVGLLLFFLLALPLSLPVFYLVGGRRVNELHRAALSRARRDGLTDLENHRAFQDELEREVASAARNSTPLELALLDVDDFKAVNDTRGHQHGDHVLIELADTLRASGRAGDRAFRLGGDEFAVLLPRTAPVDARGALDRMRAQALRRLEGTTISVGHASVAETAASDRSADVLWGRADSALYEAKRRGGGAVVSFGEVRGPDPVVTVEKVGALRRLLDDGQLTVAFQPIWDLGGERVMGYEALARPAATHGFAGPLEAFFVAESSGQDHELDALCRSAALRRADELPAEALLFLNYAPRTLTRARGAADRLREATAAVGLDPERVVVEVSERSSAAAAAIAPEAQRLRELGFRVALDDVGAGNAGLAMLREMPVDFVKIDRAVVAAAVEDRGARAVLVSVVSFAREIDAFVVAEGIETSAMLDLVRRPWGTGGEPGVQGAQGFLLGEPAGAPEVDSGMLARAGTG